jgi:hypothetical protein
MGGWFHFVLQIASVVSLFALKPEREALHVSNPLPPKRPPSAVLVGLIFQESLENLGNAMSIPAWRKEVNLSWNLIR